MVVAVLRRLHFSLDNFQGPLEYLMQLIQKRELQITEIQLIKLINQFIEVHISPTDQDMESSAEFVSSIATLLWWKSRELLPADHQEEGQLGEEDHEASLAILEKLVDYCSFKELAKELSTLEGKGKPIFHRGLTYQPAAKKPRLGIEHLEIDDLAGIFQDLIKTTKKSFATVDEEEWIVSERIAFIEKKIASSETTPFRSLFSPEPVKEELIVTFLALLELMKLEKICLYRENKTSEIFIRKP